MVPFQSILFPTDFSDCARTAFHLAGSLAGFHGAKLIVMHVNDALYGKQTYAGIEVEIRPEAYPQQLLEQLKCLKPPYPEVPVEYLLTEGSPVEEILRIAREKACDLIVMGTQGRTGFRRWILGSVTEQVLRQAPCPVLTIPPAEYHAG